MTYALCCTVLRALIVTGAHLRPDRVRRAALSRAPVPRRVERRDNRRVSRVAEPRPAAHADARSRRRAPPRRRRQLRRRYCCDRCLLLRDQQL